MKYLLLCIAVLFCSTLSAQNYGNAVPDTAGYSLSEEDVQSLILLKTILNDKPAYELYRTENVWTFLKLETSTGKIWQVQYAVGDDDAFETVLSDVSLAFDGVEMNGRFKLYPTDNIYNFILLDTSAGSVYQVQWSHEPENRMVVPIYRY